MKTLNLGYCTINSLQINNSTPISLNGTGIEIGSIDLNPSGDNLDKNFIELSGDLGESNVKILSHCTLQSNEDFFISKPIEVESDSPINLVTIGKFFNTKGIRLNGSCTLLSLENISAEGLEITIDNCTEHDKIVVKGKFLSSTINISSNIFLEIDGQLGILNLNEPNLEVDLYMNLGSKVHSMDTIESNINVSGSEESVQELLNDYGGTEKLILKSISYVVDFISGKGLANIGMKKQGMYKVKAYVLIGDGNKIPIGSPVNIIVKE